MKKIVTIHDILFLDFPDLYSKRDYALLKFSTENSLKRADQIITISNFTRERLLYYYPYLNDIEVVYNPIEPKVNFNENLVFKKPFLLSVSNRTKRKNLEITIKAFLKSKFYKNGYYLYLCGTNDSGFKKNYNKQIIDLGYVNEIKLNSLFANAEALLFFSLGEGFGYPILEAAKYKTPVFAANNSSISELFDYRDDLLCNDYNNEEGIKYFLDNMFLNDLKCKEIIEVIYNKFLECSSQKFNKKMIDIYIK